MDKNQKIERKGYTEKRNMNKISHTTLNEKAQIELKKYLMSGAFMPGEVLTIRGLANEFGISATPMREALKSLIAEGALIIQSNRSIAVPTLTREQFQELRMIRVALEGLCGELATLRIHDNLICTLNIQHAQMSAAVDNNNVHDYMHLNKAFHLTLYQAAQCDTLLSYIENLWLRVGPYMTLLFKSDSFYKEATLAHEQILKALSAGNATAVREAVQQDIDNAAQHLLTQLED
ncbi:MAG: GntR family transcriptional regulator [Pseudomonadota bacterium]